MLTFDAIYMGDGKKFNSRLVLKSEKWAQFRSKVLNNYIRDIATIVQCIQNDKNPNNNDATIHSATKTVTFEKPGFINAKKLERKIVRYRRKRNIEIINAVMCDLDNKCYSFNLKLI